MNLPHAKSRLTTPMRRLLLLVLLLLVVLATPMMIFRPATAAAGERAVREFAAGDFLAPNVGALLVGRLTTTAPADRNLAAWTSAPDAVTVAADSADPHGPRRVPLLAFDNGMGLGVDYAMRGDVSYQDVEGTAFLEMWSYFPDGGAYFSRTLADAGPMMKITGSSATRPFTLPFHSRPGYEPSRLALNLVLPGRGKVTISGIKLIASEPVPAASVTSAAGDSPALAAERDQLAAQLAAARLARINAKLEYEAASAAAGDPARLRQMAGPNVVTRLDPEGADLRKRLNEQLNDVKTHLEFLRKHYAANSPELTNAETVEETLEKRIALDDRKFADAYLVSLREEELKAARREQALQQLLDEPKPPPSPQQPQPRGAGRLPWLGEHFAITFALLIGFFGFLTIPMRLLTKRGQGRWFVLGVMGSVLAIGLADLAGAVAAILLRKPPGVTLELLGCGLLALLCGWTGLRGARDLYRRMELRKIAAMDAG